jgi:hypothetical protein
VSAASAASVAVGAFGSPVTLNDFVVVWCWGGNNTNPPTSGQVTCSDNGATPNTYTQIAFKGLTSADTANHCFSAIFVAQITSNPSSGNINPTISVAGASQFVVGCAAEFSGGTTTTDGSSNNGNSNSVNNAPTAGNISTAVANDLLLATFGMDQPANLTSITIPGSYTNVGKTTSETVMAGSGDYQIVSGTVTNNNPAWTLVGANTQTGSLWTAVQAALQPAAGGGGGIYMPHPMMRHLGDSAPLRRQGPPILMRQTYIPGAPAVTESLFMAANLATGAGGPFFVNPLG